MHAIMIMMHITNACVSIVHGKWLVIFHIPGSLTMNSALHPES